MEYLQNLINETVKQQMNESIMLNNETSNLQKAINILQNTYDRITYNGMSRHEISVAKIAKMVQDLMIIQKHWRNVKTW